MSLPGASLTYGAPTRHGADKVVYESIEHKQSSQPFEERDCTSHTPKKTLAYMRQQNINCITPRAWMPNSPDAARWILLSRDFLKDAYRGYIHVSTLWQGLNEHCETN